MIDLHSHILPGIDDGASDAVEALAMVKLAASSGTRGIVATPHVQGGRTVLPWDEITESCYKLQQAARQTGETIEILPGAEVSLDPILLDYLRAPGPYCINGGRYILVELPASHVPDYADEFLFTLQTRGFIPVIAHPERHSSLMMHQRDLLHTWVRRGILMQLTASSFTGRLGKAAKRAAEGLLLSRAAHCIGTDAHGIDSRRPDLAGAAAKILDLVGSDEADKVLGEYPGLIVEDRIFELPEVLDGADRSSGYRSLLARVSDWF